MFDGFMGTIQYFSFNFAPLGYMQCIGQSLLISQNQALFALLGFTYGGDNSTKFNLPDLQGRTMIGIGQNPNSGYNYVLGQAGGSEAVPVPSITLPVHTHTVNMQIAAYPGPGNVTQPQGAYPAAPLSASEPIYALKSGTGVNLGGPTVTVANGGASTPFSVLSPYLALNCCIAIYGDFPPRD